MISLNKARKEARERSLEICLRRGRGLFEDGIIGSNQGRRTCGDCQKRKCSIQSISTLFLADMFLDSNLSSSSPKEISSLFSRFVRVMFRDLKWVRWERTLCSIGPHFSFLYIWSLSLFWIVFMSNLRRF